jgi:dGTPase
MGVSPEKRNQMGGFDGKTTDFLSHLHPTAHPTASAEKIRIVYLVYNVCMNENDTTEIDSARYAPEHRHSIRDEFERDRSRLLHSSAFRRLASKTQVLSPDTNDFLRNRLTHSLEVEQIGIALAARLGLDKNVVAAACLAHDIGHPPFGHLGETVLDEIADEYGGFEGNAQTLRVIIRLEPKRYSFRTLSSADFATLNSLEGFSSGNLPEDGSISPRPVPKNKSNNATSSPNNLPQQTIQSYGLNLTRKTLNACIKYPWERYMGPGGLSTKKFGVYADDLDVYNWIREPYLEGFSGAGTDFAGTDLSGTISGGATRKLGLFEKSPEAQAMDWADDIGYSVHDLEDGIASGAIDIAKYTGSAGAGFAADFSGGTYLEGKDPSVGGTNPSVAGSSVANSDSENPAATNLRNLAEISLKYLDSAISSDVDRIARGAEALFAEDFFVKKFNGSPTDLADLKNTTSSLISRFIENIACEDDLKNERTLIEIALLKALSLGSVINPYQNSSESDQHIETIHGLFDKLYRDFDSRITSEEALMFSLDTPWALAGPEKKMRAVVDYIACLTDNSAALRLRELF